MSSELFQPITHKLEKLKIKPTTRVLHVSITKQRLSILEDGLETREYEVSTSSNPPSALADSYGTPMGLHRVESKHGHGAPIGEVFVGRVSIGKRYEQLSSEEQNPNLVTTRILWLSGLEPGLNQGPGHDSYERYIYIHGTNHEGKIGQPASGGCIVLRNAEMIELFEYVNEGDLVYIEA